MTSETTEGAGTEAPDAAHEALALEAAHESLTPEAPYEVLAPEAPYEPAATLHEVKTPTERFASALAPANETPPPPPPEPANSDVESDWESDWESAADAGPAAGPGPGPARAQEWPLAWLRLVEPEPPATDDDVVAAVIAAEPADADGVAHAFGHDMDAAVPAEPADADGVADAFGRVMAAALDPESVLDAEEAVESAACAFYSVPVVESLEEASAAGPDGRSPAEAGGDAHAAPAERAPAAEAEEKVVAEPDEPAFVTPVYAARRAAARRAAAEGDASAEGRAGEGGPATAAYLLCLAGFLLLPAVVGVMIAYNARRTAPAWLESHYLFLIRTFWIGVAGTAAAAALLFSGMLTLAGLVLGLLLIVWVEVRCALGFIRVVKLRPVRRPRSWLL